jgi:hypothetical protein
MMREITMNHMHDHHLKEIHKDLEFHSIDNDYIVEQRHTSVDHSTTDILFCDVPYTILEAPPNATVSSKILTLEEFYHEHRLMLPAGIKAIFRARIQVPVSQTSLPLPAVPPITSSSIQQHTLSYRDTKNAIEILNPWFIYTEVFHRCRTEYDICHRSIDMLSTQSLNKDLLRELLVLLYGQKFMITAPDLYAEFHLFLSYFQTTLKDKSKQIWIDVQRFDETYGNQKVEDAHAIPKHSHQSLGSLSTVPQSNQASYQKEKITPRILIEV